MSILYDSMRKLEHHPVLRTIILDMVLLRERIKKRWRLMMDWCKHGLPKTSWCWHCEKEDVALEEAQAEQEKEEKKKEGIVIRI